MMSEETSANLDVLLRRYGYAAAQMSEREKSMGSRRDYENDSMYVQAHNAMCALRDAIAALCSDTLPTCETPKFVQLCTGTFGDGADGGTRDYRLFALGDDGSVWKRIDGHRKTDDGWYEVGGFGRSALDSEYE